MSFDIYDDVKTRKKLELAYGRPRTKVMITAGRIKRPNMFRKFRQWYNKPSWNKKVF